MNGQNRSGSLASNAGYEGFFAILTDKSGSCLHQGM